MYLYRYVTNKLRSQLKKNTKKISVTTATALNCLSLAMGDPISEYILSEPDSLLAEAINTFDTITASEAQAPALKGKLNKTIDPSDVEKEPTTRKEALSSK
jgi:hypothetical protein